MPFLSCASSNNNLSSELNIARYPDMHLASLSSKGVCMVVPWDFSRSRPVEITPEFVKFRFISSFPCLPLTWCQRRFSLTQIAIEVSNSLLLIVKSLSISLGEKPGFPLARIWRVWKSGTSLYKLTHSSYSRESRLAKKEIDCY